MNATVDRLTTDERTLHLATTAVATRGEGADAPGLGRRPGRGAVHALLRRGAAGAVHREHRVRGLHPEGPVDRHPDVACGLLRPMRGLSGAVRLARPAVPRRPDGRVGPPRSHRGAGAIRRAHVESGLVETILEDAGKPIRHPAAARARPPRALGAATRRDAHARGLPRQWRGAGSPGSAGRRDLQRPRPLPTGAGPADPAAADSARRRDRGHPATSHLARGRRSS